MTTEDNAIRVAKLEEAIRRRRDAAHGETRRLPIRPIDEEPWLGEMQQGIWLLQQLEPTSPAYHLTSAFRVAGSVDTTSLERGLNAVVARHRLLRSTFEPGGDGVRQVVHGELPVPLERFAAGADEALVTAVREARRPLDLVAGPLLRLLLIEEPEGTERLLVLVVHHLIADARSLDILWGEFERHFDDRSLETEAGRQYDDYVSWTRRYGVERRAVDLSFWQRKLEPLPGDLELPFERPAGSSPRGGRLLRRSFPTLLQDRVRTSAAAIGTTPFVVLAFVFRLLLHRYTEAREIAFATPVSTRSHPDTAEMIGYFLNPMVVYTSIDESRHLEEALREFNREVQECLQHASLPFHELVEALSPPRREDRHPLFQAMFVFQEATRPPRLGDATLEPVALDLGASKFDLTLFATVGDDEAELAVEYRADRFEPVWIEGLLRHYTVLLEQLDTGLERPTQDLGLLNEDESAALERQAQGPAAELPAEPLLPQRIVDRLTRSAEATAVVGVDGDWSCGDLSEAALRIADSLVRHGVEPADRVGLFIDRSPWMIAGILGVQLAGGAYVPLDPADPPARTGTVLEDADVSAIVTRSSLGRSLHDLSQPKILVDSLDTATDRPALLPRLRPEHPAYVLYTSGSTGRPKGVVVSHANLLASTSARPLVYETRPKRFLLLPSVAFDSSVAGIFWSLAEGGTLVLPSDEEITSPKRLARLIHDHEITTLLCVPSLYSRLLEAGRDRLRSLETMIVAGESCPRRLVEEHFRWLPGTRLFNEYGPTEATVWATVHEFDASEPEPSVPIGRPIPGVRVDLLDDRGRTVPVGIPAEAWITGPTVARGYWRRPELTTQRFRPGESEPHERHNRRFRTGDRMSWTADGRLLFHGRLDDQIKLRGFRIEPMEVESALLGVAGVREAAVVARDAAQLVAFVTSDHPIKDWSEALSSRLPSFMLPNRLVELAEMPRLPNGKIDRRRLEAVDLESEAPAEDHLPPRTDREKVVASLWESLLGYTGVGVTDNFFRIGGHSLLAVEMTVLLERDLGLAVEPAEVFQHPTIRGLLSHLDRSDRDEGPTYAHLFPIQPGGDGTPLAFCVPHFFSEMVGARFRGERPVYGLRGVSLRQEGNRGRWPTMEALGKDLVDEITRRFPQQPIIMAGYSFGATMAVEAVRQMEARGLTVEHLYLIAPMPLDFLRLGPFRLQVDALRQPVKELSFGQALGRIMRYSHPLTPRFYRRARRFLVTQPWRRLLCLTGAARKRLGLALTPRILHADVRVERFRLHANYRPGAVDTPTVIFNATEPETDAAATWRPFFGDSLTVLQIPDPHRGDRSAEAAREVILDYLHDLTESPEGSK